MGDNHNSSIQKEVEALFRLDDPPRTAEALSLLKCFREALNTGSIRVAEIVEGVWRVNVWVKMGILLHARLGSLVDSSPFGDRTCFDYDTLPQRRFTADDQVRVPAGGSTIRDGVYLAPGVVCMPPSMVNIGTWVGPGTTIDSHVTVGACAQIGRNVRISCGTSIGGVIEPLEAMPAIIGDDVVIGGNSGIYDGVFVGAGAVIGAGTILTAQSRVYDFRQKKIFRAAPSQPLVIPPLSVVLPGARPILKGPAEGSGLLIQVSVIVASRNELDANGDLLEELMP